MSLPAETLSPLEPSPLPGEAIVAPSNVGADVVERLRNGDVEAFELLFRTHAQSLIAFAARYVRSRDAAEDLVQDVFRRLWERRASWAVHSTPRGFLYTAVRNDALNTLRHERVVEESENEILWQEGDWVPGFAQGAAAPADAGVLADEIEMALARAIDGLPQRAQQAYRLQRDHGLSYVEIAEVMGVTAKSVERLLWRAHLALRDSLSHLR